MSESRKSTPGWDVCVLSDKANYSDLKNSLLYADSVYWFSSEMLTAELHKGIKPGIYKPTIKREPSRPLGGFNAADFISSSGDPPLILGAIGLSEIPPTPRPEYGLMLDEVVKSGGGNLFFPLTYPEEMEDRRLEDRFYSLYAKLDKAIRNSKCIIGAPREVNEPWNTYKATLELQSAVSRLLLPDLSDLPISGIMEIRERTKDVMDPMRAELLRFTETLREMVKNSKNDPDSIRHEAENLVATKIEPVVREAGHKTRDLAEQKWRKLFAGAAKAFGFAGAAFVDPKLIAKAVTQTLETGALAFQSPEDKTPGPKMSAQFVLQAHSYLSELAS